MNKIIPIILVFGVLAMMSCKPLQTESLDDYTPYFAIYGHSINSLKNDGRSLDKSSNSIQFSLYPREFDYMMLEPSTTDAVLWRSVSQSVRKLDESASDMEAFAFDHIIEKESYIEKEFQQYVKDLGRPKSNHHSNGLFISVFVRGTPSIVANQSFMGRPPGSDLSDCFIFKDQNIIGISGKDWTLSKRADQAETYLTTPEFFVKDKMLPLRIWVRTVGLPEEVSVDPLDLASNGGADPINVTISIPVTYERYWDWCKELYINPDAVERFTEGEIKSVIPFVRK